ncbi:MAG TPA: cytochrome c maturation protein CcmE [Thermoleophilia bacterium]|nr:cytochrome c maturation protein CcmE [Thermoleophilia bacterium]
MSSRAIKILAGAVVVAVAVGALVWVGVGRSSVYYYTVSELLAKGPTQQVRVSGELVGGSVEGLGTKSLKFVLHDRDRSDQTISVVFNGNIPDSFRDQANAEVVAEGDLVTGDSFAATLLMPKCPSKYEAAP